MLPCKPSSTTKPLSVKSTAQCCSVTSMGALRSKHNRISVPAPSFFTTLMSPPILLTKFLTMQRPRPVPPCSRVVDGSACSKLSNTESHLLGSIPQPVSSTSNQSITLLSFIDAFFE
ncbi:hypothetical protein V8G54_015028 [Vigna mungo]|uniref:Uncharacterized protein n=1 Tax=Vigna mungo TaxID=3915 RepID=A0AAQ3NKG2_VIGMU